MMQYVAHSILKKVENPTYSNLSFCMVVQSTQLKSTLHLYKNSSRISVENLSEEVCHITLQLNIINGWYGRSLCSSTLCKKKKK